MSLRVYGLGSFFWLLRVRSSDLLIICALKRVAFRAGGGVEEIRKGSRFKV